MAWSFLQNDLAAFQNDQAISSFLCYGLATGRQRSWPRAAEIFKIFRNPLAPRKRMSTGTDPIAEAPSEGLSPHFLRHTPAFPGHEAHRIRKGDGERRFAGACGRPQLSPRPNPLTLTPQRQYLYAAKVLPLCRKGTTVTLERYYLLGGKVLPF